MSFIKKNIVVTFLFAALKLSAQEYSITNITVNDGLPSNIIYDVQQDKIGYLWIATEKGLVKYDGDDFVEIHKNKTTTIFIDDETIYSGLENGLFVKNKSIEKYFESKKVTTIFKYKNDVFTGTIEGIYSLKGQNLVPLKFNSTIDFSIINDAISYESGFYLCSSNGLFELHKKLNNNELKELKRGYFTSIDKSYNSFIASEINGEVFEIKNDSCSKILETLRDISSVKKIKNELWFTSKTEGIEVHTLPSFSFKQKINKYNSLQTNAIYAVFIDNQNAIFIASKKGLYQIKKNRFQQSKYTKPDVHFESIRVNHQNLDTLLSSKNIELPHLKNNISITFKTVDLSNPKKIQYRYQLNGVFSPWSANNTVQFANLNAGKYIFKVQSKINNKESSIESFSFNIEAPFYKKAWFYFSLVITLLAITYILLDSYIKRINTKNQKKVNQLKLQNRLLSLEQKALQLQMNPHFIFNVLNGIKALGNNRNTKELNSTISKFSLLLRGILNNSRKDEISLGDEIILLQNYIELEQRMSSKSFSYNINTKLNNIDKEEILIPTMLIQPFVENSIQHAFNKNTKGEIQIDFEVKHRFLHFAVIDNGIGINQSKKRKGNSSHKSIALQVSKERLLAINKYSRLKIDEITNEKKEVVGTRVNFKIPLKTDY